MAQSFIQNVSPWSVHASNLLVNSGASETIILDHIPCMGLKSISVTIVNYTGTTTACALYGSCDGVHYKAVASFSTFGVGTGAVGHALATDVYQFLRLTTTGVANIDAHIIATT